MVKKLQVSQNFISQSKIQTHKKKKEKTKSRTRKELAWAQGGASEPWDSSSELLKKKKNLWIRSNIQIYNLLINVDRFFESFSTVVKLKPKRNDASDVGLEASSDSPGALTRCPHHCICKVQMDTRCYAIWRNALPILKRPSTTQSSPSPPINIKIRNIMYCLEFGVVCYCYYFYQFFLEQL